MTGRRRPAPVRSDFWCRSIDGRFSNRRSPTINHCRDNSVGEALIQIYLSNGVSIRHVEDIPEALWGSPASTTTVSGPIRNIHTRNEIWRNQPFEGDHPSVIIDKIAMHRRSTDEVCHLSLLVAIGIISDGYQGILSICVGTRRKIRASLFSASPDRPRPQGHRTSHHFHPTSTMRYPSSLMRWRRRPVI